MACLNKVTLIGNLGSDPEIKTTAQGVKLARFNVAVTEKYKDQQNQKQEKTQWFTVVLWRRLAEIAEQFLKKGAMVYIEGKLDNSSWDDEKTGEKKYKTEIHGLNMQMLSSSKHVAEYAVGHTAVNTMAY
ncbi:MAG: single-stranded DNA-binding protein [Fibrobacterales bacterium]